MTPTLAIASTAVILAALGLITAIWERRNARFNARIDGLESGQGEVQQIVSRIDAHVVAQNGRVGDLEDWRTRLTETPPWQEVLLKQASMSGKLDSVLVIINQLQHER